MSCFLTRDSSSHYIGVPILLFHRSAALLDSDSDDPRFEDAKRMEHETRQNYVQVPGAWIASYPFITKITKPSEYNKAKQITTALSVRSATKKIPSEVQTSVTRLLKAQLSQAVQDLFETSRIHWQSVISIDFPHDATNFGRNSLEPTVLSFRWEHPVVFYFDS